eukprot:6190487-Pleurochrysis_carterae.AAC.1
MRAQVAPLEHRETRHHALEKQVVREAREEVLAEVREAPRRALLAKDGLLGRRRRRQQHLQLALRRLVVHTKDLELAVELTVDGALAQQVEQHVV